MAIGDSFFEVRKITKKDVESFSDVSGDRNPIHLDDSFASQTIFKRPIAHGMLLASYISKVIGNDFPGFGSIYISQTLNFLSPAFFDDDVIVSVEIVDIFGSRKNKIKLKTTCKRLIDETELLVGEAVVIAPAK